MTEQWMGRRALEVARTAVWLVVLTVGLTAAQADGQQEPPRSPAPLQPLTVTQLDGADGFESNRPISLSFAEPVPIKDVLLLLGRDTNLSLVPDVALEGSFVGDLKNVTFRQALEAILQPLALDYTVQDNIIRVFKQRTVTRIFDVNYVVTRRSGTPSVSNSSAVAGGGFFNLGGSSAPGAATSATGGATLGGSSSQGSGTDAGDLFGEFETGLKTLLSPDAKYNLDRRAGLLQVMDYPDRLDKVALYLAAVQTRANRQVQIEAKVIEVELNDTSAAGINWSQVLGRAWSQVLGRAGKAVTLIQTLAPTTSGGLTLGIDINDLDGLLTALATQGKVNVLSSPHVMAMNNEPALMRVGTQDVFFVTTSQVDAMTGRVLQTTVTPSPITEGVVLSVTPQIAADGVIHMSISPSVTERTGQATSRLGDTAPIISVRESDTLVRIHPGETVVIAGLMQDRVTKDTTKVRLLGDLPIIGGLFRREEINKRKTDLVILLTPTVMMPGGAMETTARKQEELYESQKALKK